MNTSFFFTIDPKLNDSARDVLMSRLIYSLESTTACQYIAEDSSVRISAPLSDRDNVEMVVAQIIAEVQAGRFLPKRILHDNLAERRSPSVSATAPASLKPSEHNMVLAAVEQCIRQICAPHAIENVHYPSMIPTRTMDRCSYLHTFPQNAFLVDQFPHNYLVLKGIKAAADYQDLRQPSGNMLSPATCFHFYDQMADTTVGDNLATIAKSRCFRHEAEWRIAPHRLREFEMLELILLGAPDYVEETRSTMIRQIWTLFAAIGLQGFIETANDPFYFPDDSAKGQYQLLASTKYELVAVSETNGLQCAVASFNNVGNSLTKNFNIRNERGEFPHSGCIAFGLDRLVVALGWEHGNMLALWPSDVLNLLGMEGCNDA